MNQQIIKKTKKMRHRPNHDLPPPPSSLPHGSPTPPPALSSRCATLPPLKHCWPHHPLSNTVGHFLFKTVGHLLSLSTVGPPPPLRLGWLPSPCPFAAKTPLEKSVSFSFVLQAKHYLFHLVRSRRLLASLAD